MFGSAAGKPPAVPAGVTARRDADQRNAHASRCTGVDISAPMIEAARARAGWEGATADFLLADAETHRFEQDRFDRIVSRFGVMFFGDPIAAFANLRRSARRGAALDLIAWRSAEDNPFMSGEAQSRPEIVVPAPQQALAEAVAAVGKPVVVVLKNGRALALQGAVASAPAILVTWFLGTESGNATADVLFGDYGPSGRLPSSFPRSPGQQPYYYAHKPTGRPNPSDDKLEPYKAHYRGIPNKALYPFGHGLTYGKIEYSGLQVAPTLACGTRDQSQNYEGTN